MRKWLRENIDMEADDYQDRADKLIANFVSKAEFLVKLEEPAFFKTMDPNQSLFELSHRIPSYLRDDIKDAEELKETSGDRANLWREHYKSWRSSLKREGTILSRQ